MLDNIIQLKQNILLQYNMLRNIEILTAMIFSWRIFFREFLVRDVFEFAPFALDMYAGNA